MGVTVISLIFMYLVPLFGYDPVASPGATVMDSSGLARFTILTPRLIRMEETLTRFEFEDRATLAIVNRALPLVNFTHKEVNGVLTIQTSFLTLTYNVGSEFSAANLKVVGSMPSSFFKAWAFGDFDTGNLLGTIRGLDKQHGTNLNCTENRGLDDNGEENHCEFGVVSKNGWVVYNDSTNFALGEDGWWSPVNRSQCPPPSPGLQPVDPQASRAFPVGVRAGSSEECCSLCASDPTCLAGFVYVTGGGVNCFPLATWTGFRSVNQSVSTFVHSASPNSNAHDLYGFFHGHDYKGALEEFVLVSGRMLLPPRFASGVWASRWYDYSSGDALAVVREYEQTGWPLDAFVLDVNWHTKNDWTGFTFDSALFPHPSDTVRALQARGLGVLVNIHDADGVNVWESKYPELLEALGLPENTSSRIPLDLLNANVSRAVDRVVLGDILYNQSVDALWIDWQSGGYAGGLTGGKANPTFFLAHLRGTLRARGGSPQQRDMVLSRFGGLGAHRYPKASVVT